MYPLYHSWSWLRHGALILAVSGLTACNGGGGGGGGPDPIFYTGSTAPAAITGLNAVALAGGAYLTGTAGAAVNVFGAQTTTTTIPHGPRSLLVAKALKKSVALLKQSASPAMAAGAMIEDRGSIPGTCMGKQGSLGYSMSIDNITGYLEGTLNFRDLCLDADPLSPADDITMSGRMNIQGYIDPVLLQSMILAFNQMTLETSVLNISTIDDTFGVAGNIGITNIMFPPETITQSLRFKGPDGTVAQNENYVMHVYYDLPSGFDTIIISSGKFFLPNEGYVDVEGTANFEVEFTSLFPRAGGLKIAGAGGSWAELMALGDAQTFDVDVHDGFTFSEIDGNRWDAL